MIIMSRIASAVHGATVHSVSKLKVNMNCHLPELLS